MSGHDTRLRALVWTVNAASVCANVAVYLYCAHVVQQRTGSVFLSSVVFSAQWVLPIVLGGLMPRVNARWRPRTAVAAAVALELAVLGVLPLAHVAAVPFLVAGALGGLELVVKVTRLVLLKEASTPTALSRNVAVTSTGQFAGAALSGVLFAVALAEPRVPFFAILAALYLIALLATLFLPRGDRASAKPAASLRHGLTALRRDPLLLRALVGLVTASALLQGFHNIARIELPRSTWDSPDTGVGLLQATAACATVLGALLFSAAPARLGTPRAVLAATGLSAVAMTAATLPLPVATGLAVYAVYIVLFESAFMAHQAEITARTPAEEISPVVSVQFITVNAALALSIGVGGFLAEHAGLTATAVLFAAVCTAVTVWSTRHPSGVQTATRCVA